MISGRNRKVIFMSNLYTTSLLCNVCFKLNAKDLGKKTLQNAGEENSRINFNQSFLPEFITNYTNTSKFPFITFSQNQ